MITDCLYKFVYSKQANWINIVLLLLSVAIIYWPVYQFEFVIGWDDQWFVTNAYTQHGLNWKNISAIFTHFHHGQYAPLNQLYYTCIYYLAGYNPAYYHIAGVVVHGCNVLLVYGLIHTLARQFTRETLLPVKLISFFTALIFAVLPINVEPVAWVSASKVTLYALFYLMALICYIHYLRNRRATYFYLTLFFFICSFGAKEQAVSLPLCLLLFDYLFQRKLNTRSVWMEKMPFFILALLFGLITIQSQGFEDTDRSFYPLYQRIPLAAYTLSEYFTKCWLPIHLSYLYPFPFQSDESVPLWLWLYVIILPILGYCFYPKFKAPWLLFGLGFFLIHIVLVINLTSLARFSVVADRYAYIASIGVCFMISFSLVKQLYQVKRPLIIAVVALIYICSLGIYASVHLTVWNNTYSLKEKLKKTIERRADFDELKKLK